MNNRKKKALPRTHDRDALLMRQTVCDFLVCPWVFDDDTDPLLVLPIEDHGVKGRPSVEDVLESGCRS